MKKQYIKVFMISFLISFILFIPNIIQNNGIFIVGGDFHTQQNFFNINVNNEIKNGNTLYTLNNDLGSSIVEGYSFYDLASPFFLIGLLFNVILYPYIISILMMFKFAFTSLFAYIYLKTFIKNDKLLLLGSLLYSFSGFQICNIMFYHFYESVMIFPLLLYSIDQFFKNNKKYFPLILALTFMFNYVFAFGQMVFIFIYVILNLIYKNYDFNIKKLLILCFTLY